MSNLAYIICDNQFLTQTGLKTVLKLHDKNATINVATNMCGLKNMLAENEFSLIILDYELFDFEEISNLIDFTKAFPRAFWLFIASVINEAFILQLTREIPQANFVLKSNRQEDILTAIASTEKSKKYYCSEALDVILGQNLHKVELVNPINGLTPTEKEIVQLLAYGKTTKEIAFDRCLSFHTINTHRKNIFRKLGVCTVHDLTKLALKHGLVDLTEYYI